MTRPSHPSTGYVIVGECELVEDPKYITIEILRKMGHDRYFVQFLNEFHDHNTWRQTQTIAFSAWLLGTMLFPQDEGKEIETWVVMAADNIYRGIGKKQKEKKHCSLAPVILADIYRSLSLCKNGFTFFQGCNILLQWWMTEHLCKRNGTQQQNLGKPSRMSPLDAYEFYLSIRRF